MKIEGNKIFKFTLLVLFLLFIGLYITQAFGYYEFSNNKKTALTEQAIKRFENDVKEGKKIDANNYIENEKHYNNLLSNTSIKISNSISIVFNSFMNNLFNQINKLTSSSN